MRTTSEERAVRRGELQASAQWERGGIVAGQWHQYPAVLPTYTGWRWVCPTCQAWGRTETRWGARRRLVRHQRTCQEPPRIIWERMDLYTGRGL